MRVYIEDTDAGKIVYYVNYLKFMERARTEFFRMLGFTKPAMIADGLLLVVASAEVQYKTAARLDDLLEVGAQMEKIARCYVIFNQRVLRSGECLCQGRVKVACVDRETMQPRPMPKNVSDALKQFVGENH